MVDDNLSNDLKANSIVFGALTTGVVIFAFASLAINKMNGSFINDPRLAEIFLIVVIAISAICLFSAHMIYNKRQNIRQSAGALAGKTKTIQGRADTLPGIDRSPLPYFQLLVFYRSVIFDSLQLQSSFW